MQLGLEPRGAGLPDEQARGERHVVGRAVHQRAEPGAVGELEPRADRVPQPGLDRHQRATRAEQPRRLLEAGAERPLEGDVVEHEAVQDHVERGGLEGQLARPALGAGVELARLEQVLHHRRVEIGPGHAPSGAREQMAAGVPAAADRQDVAAGQPEPALEQRALAPVLLVVVDLQGGRVRAAVQQVVGVVGLAHHAPRARMTAGIVFSMIVRSRKTDQRSR